jgi:hypothetical protein
MYVEHKWGWNQLEYNWQTREEVSTGIGTSLFYNGLWDIVNYLEAHPFEGGRPGTLG